MFFTDYYKTVLCILNLRKHFNVNLIWKFDILMSLTLCCKDLCINRLDETYFELELVSLRQ